MTQLTNLEVEKVYEGPKGVGEHGPWGVYNLYFKGGKKKFGYMWSEGKPIPIKGTKVLFLDFKTESNTGKDGKTYENNKITKIEFEEGTPTKDNSQTQKSDLSPQDTSEQKQECKAYIDHGKCIIELMRLAGAPEINTSTFETLIDIFKFGVDRMTGNGQPKPPSEEPPPLIDNDIPY